MQPFTLLWLALPKAEAGTTTHYLTDASGLEYWVIDDLSFTSSYGYASGALLEANYTTSVTASTVSGGTTVMYLSDAFDGYGGIWVDGTQYGLNGPSTSECGDRQVVLATQAIGGLSVWRKVYVPDDDAFARMIVFVRNDGAKDYSTTVGFVGNLGSDGDTIVMASSSGDTTADLTDDWAVSKQNFTSSSMFYDDPRLGHVWQDGLGSVVADELTLVDGNDSFHWRFSVTIPAGQTIAIMTFVTGQPTVAAAQLQAETLVGLPDTAVACLAKDELASIVNWSMGPDCSHLDDQCNTGEFDSKLGVCVATPANEAGACDDGLACTQKDVCGAGTCAGIESDEIAGDGIDEDCTVGEICFADADDDGHAAEDGSTLVSKDADCDDAGEATNKDVADDCDDAHADAYPGGTEVANDGIDQDCNGKDLVKKTGGDDSGTADGGGAGDDGGGDDGAAADSGGEDKGGCSCGTSRAPAPLSALVLLGVVGLVTRRRRA